MGSFMRNWTGTDRIPFHSQLSRGKMATASEWNELEDYSKEELEGEENDESDIDIGGGGEEEVREDEEVSDPEDEVPLLTLQQTWRPATHAPNVKPFEKPVGPSHSLPKAAKPLDYFFLFLPQTFFETASEETNRYARQKIAAKGTPDPLWSETTAEEIRVYLSILIMMGIKKQPRLWCYWSTDMRFNDPWISSVMPKTRFLKLNQYFHLRDTSNAPARDSPQYDPLYKIRNFINLILPLFKSNFNPGRDLSVDEAMIGYKGRIFFKQYMPAKPTKWGIKVWEMCDSETGYCVTFDIYTGRHSRENTTVSLGEEVVTKLASPYFNQNRHLYFDRFFTSVPLLKHLSENGTYACATVMPNRKGLPDEVKTARLREKGDLLQMQKGPLMATAYKDNRQIYLLSSNQPPGKTTVNGKPVPSVIAAYNKNMGGVDKSDQHRAYYPVGHANKKWWRYIFHSLVNLCLVQAFITWDNSPHDPSPKKGYDHLLFRADVAEQIRGGFTSRKRKAGRSKAVPEPPIAMQTINHHKLVKIEGRKKICRQCDNAGRRTPANRKVETSYECSFCSVPLCRVRDCFRDYHGENIVPVAQNSGDDSVGDDGGDTDNGSDM